MNSDEAQNKEQNLVSRKADESKSADNSDEGDNLKDTEDLGGKNSSNESIFVSDRVQPKANLEKENNSEIAVDEENSTSVVGTKSAESNLPLEVKLNEENNSSEREKREPQYTNLLASQEPEKLKQEVAELQRQKESLETEIISLQSSKNQLLSQQVTEVGGTLEKMVREGLQELERRKQALEISVEQLERRRDRIREEMRTSFAGVSQDLAIRVQGFKDYLVGSLQDLAAAADQLELPTAEGYEAWETSGQETSPPTQNREGAPTPAFAEQAFQDQTRQIRNILDQYRTLPDYYGPAWQLRRTFEPIHAEKVSTWFFSQGGRGALKSMGSRLQNILLASAIISVMRNLYGDRVRTLVLANTPERLGEWRRGLQDCLGISRSDFGPERGVVLFEYPEALVQKADRLLEQKQLPLIIVDEAEEVINLALLQFPLWLAFASDPQQMSTYMY